MRIKDEEFDFKENQEEIKETSSLFKFKKRNYIILIMIVILCGFGVYQFISNKDSEIIPLQKNTTPMQNNITVSSKQDFVLPNNNINLSPNNTIENTDKNSTSQISQNFDLNQTPINLPEPKLIEVKKTEEKKEKEENIVQKNNNNNNEEIDLLKKEITKLKKENSLLKKNINNNNPVNKQNTSSVSKNKIITTPDESLVIKNELNSLKKEIEFIGNEKSTGFVFRDNVYFVGNVFLGKYVIEEITPKYVLFKYNTREYKVQY